MNTHSTRMRLLPAALLAALACAPAFAQTVDPATSEAVEEHAEAANQQADMARDKAEQAQRAAEAAAAAQQSGAVSVEGAHNAAASAQRSAAQKGQYSAPTYSTSGRPSTLTGVDPLRV